MSIFWGSSLSSQLIFKTFSTLEFYKIDTNGRISGAHIAVGGM